MNLIKDGFSISAFLSLAEAKTAIKENQKKIITIVSVEHMKEVIEHIEDNKGKLTMVIIYCNERKAHVDWIE